ncbi:MULTISPECIES: ABC transporter permease [unclassified Enterococcus]|uniref:ABC transporter permease n=1 Tax=unclassified Enterococcus TaxID=2608891 RepID=UPI0013EA8555|nr:MULTISPECIES: ABC transporter permease [unclassified Enterococcus]
MNDFFRKRLAKHQKKMMKYMRYVLNDHFVLVCLFLFGGVGLYYSNWLKSLTTPFSFGGVIISLFWLLCLFGGKMATFAEAADLVFLLPKEKEMRSYLQQAFRYSCIFPMLLLGLAGGFAMPLVVVSTGQPFSFFFVYLVILWCLKTSHLQIKRAELFRFDPALIRNWKVGWGITSMGLLLLSVYGSVWGGLIGALVQAGVYYWYLWRHLAKHLDWEKMIQMEEQRLHQIYQFINLFTDVPEITARVKRRSYLDPLLQKIQKVTSNTYLYLYARRLARGSDFSGLYLRLVVIGGILIAGITEIYFSLFIGALFLYLIGFQLLPLYSQFRYMVLVQLYPVKEEQKKQAIQRLLAGVLLFAALIFGVIAAIVLNGMERWLPMLVYLLVTGLFVKLYVPSRLKKLDD